MDGREDPRVEPSVVLHRSGWRLRCATLGVCPDCVECSDSALADLRQATRKMAKAA